MTTPVNPPGPGVLQSLSGDKAPINQIAIAATTAYDLTDKTHWQAPCASEIYFPTAGTFTGQLAGDAAAISFAVVAGATVKGAWVLIPAGNALACVARFG